MLQLSVTVDLCRQKLLDTQKRSLPKKVSFVNTRKIIKGANHFLCSMKTCRDVFRTLSKVYNGASQRAFICSKLTIETPEQGVKYVQSYQ